MLIICLPIYLFIQLSTYPSIYLPPTYLPIYLSTYLRIALSIYLWICLAACLPAWPAGCLSVCVSVYPSIYLVALASFLVGFCGKQDVCASRRNGWRPMLARNREDTGGNEPAWIECGTL